MADNFKSNFITVKPPLEMHFPFCLLADLAQLFPSPYSFPLFLLFFSLFPSLEVTHAFEILTANFIFSLSLPLAVLRYAL